MREYPIKKNHQVDEKRIYELMLDLFGKVSRDGEYIVSSYGSLDFIRVKFSNKKLYVETKSNSRKDLYEETISKYNKFVEMATGYTAAERKKMLTKS